MTSKEFVLNEPWFKIEGVAGKLRYDNPYSYAITNSGFGRIVDENGSVFGKIVVMNRSEFTIVTTEGVVFNVSFSNFLLA